MGSVVRIVVAVWASVLSLSCLSPQNTLMAGVDMQEWSDSASIAYSNSDTLTTRNLNIALRYNSSFHQVVLPLKVGITTPDARYFEEVVELKINHSHTALMVATTESLPYRSDVVLAQKGEYIFAFTPLIEVRGVEAIGIEFREIAE